jgi:hypothetical protein
MQPWFEKIPERLEYELDALRKAGYSFEIEERTEEDGRLTLKVPYPIEGESHDLKIVFPDNFPYFPVEIFAPTFPAGRHKDPYSGLLCTLKDPFKNWSTYETLANFLNTQVKQVHETLHTPEAAEGLEAKEGAQATGYFHYLPSTVVFTGQWDIPKEHCYGRLIIGLESGGDPNKALRGAVIEVQDADGNTLAQIDNVLGSRYQHKVRGRWVRLSAPPAKVAGGELEEAVKIWPALAKPIYKGAPDIVGLMFPEETQYQKFADNWLFVVRFKMKGEPKRYLARADRFSRESYQARVPRLAPIANKRVLIVGLGAVGSSCAWQLARAGLGGLHVMDYDHVQLGNLPRWQLGLGIVGHLKTDALGHYLNFNYPFLDIKGYNHQIGVGHDCLVLPKALEGVDLILDATAEKCVGNYLSDLALQQGIPYVWATGTPGSYGGAIGRVVPNKTQGCWKCYQNHLTDENFHNPPHEDLPEVQPVGCFHPTFTGTGFDMDHVSLAAVRLVISTLCSGQNAGYPDFDWDIGIVDLWNESNLPIVPTWKTYSLTQHQNCKAHG